MTQYPKIQGVFKRDPDTKEFIMWNYSTPEFQFLEKNEWLWTEKVDGMNIRVMWDAIEREIRFAGRTDKAELPKSLATYLADTFRTADFEKIFDPDGNVCLYGEGYGAGIQKGGCYSDEQRFILFDVKVGYSLWLLREDIEEIARKFGIPVVPVIGIASLKWMIEYVKEVGVNSQLKCPVDRAEGVVGQPLIPMFNRRGERIITKIKHRDFKDAS